jgi:FkbM family methyltransferase
MNFGSVEFTGEQSEKLVQDRGHDPAKAEFVPLTTIDRFEFPRADLMKIDVEGMELQVLEGSTQTIRRCRPVLFVETSRTTASRFGRRSWAWITSYTRRNGA